MKNTGQLLSYFRDASAAQDALRRLGRKGFHRRLLLQRTQAGRIVRSDPSIALRSVIAIIGGIVLCSAALALTLIPGFPHFFAGRLLPFGIIGFASGILPGWLIAKRLFPGVSKLVRTQQASSLRSEESLLILEAPLRSLAASVQVLRDSIETEVSIFALHPRRSFPELPELREASALPLHQIREHAARLAQESHIEYRGGASRVLLTRLGEARKTIHEICADLAEATRLDQSLTPVAEWILDNEYLIESHGRDVEINLSKSFFRELPTLSQDSNQRDPRVFSLARELVAHADARIDRENISAFLTAYQEVTSLTIGELWALPLMLRISLIQRVEHLARQAWYELRDRELADFWANRLLATLRREPDQLFAVLAQLAQVQANPNPSFAIHLSGHLYDEDAVLVPVQSWLERSLRRPLAELHSGEQARQAINQISIGNAISSLRQLSLLDWREVFEGQSQVELILRRDPARVYHQMDFDTRNRYREAVETLAKRSKVEESQVARKAIEMALAGEIGETGETRQQHVGGYLIGDGRSALAASIGSREALRYRIIRWIHQRPTAIYLTSIVVVTAALLAVPIMPMLGAKGSIYELLALALLSLPASQLATEWVNYLITRLLPAWRLPKLDFSKSGIPASNRSLVVVPMLLIDEATIIDEIEKLEIRYVANPENNLLFGLFADYTDAGEETAPDDPALLQIARAGLLKLNQRYGDGRFFLFHRQRRWSDSEQKFIGWERKRGKLEELNRLILGLRNEDEPSIISVGDADRLTDIRYVITLDSDTRLPRDSARRMIETMAHPLNQPQFDNTGQVTRGYSLIQPRVSPSLPSAAATPFTRIYTDPVGTDPYTKAVSNAYQDLAGEGSYIGKGIYDVRAFQRILADRFPDERLLSHDLIEGAHVRTGLATDIELFDEFPSDYISYSLRQHRWIRGDWQIADWIFPRIRDRKGHRVPNRLSILNRWKIFDNLRRSLVPPASVAALILSWLIPTHIQLYTAVITTGVILFQPLAGPLTWATSAKGLRGFSLRQIGHDLSRALAEAALLLHQAGLALDASVRVLYRRLVSRRRMLEWTTAQMTEWGVNKRNIFQHNFWLIALLSTLVAISVYVLRPQNLMFALPWLLLWLLSPLVNWRLTRKPASQIPRHRLSAMENRLLRRVARRTWRFFADFVGPDSAWLPPDNYQVSHKNRLAMRTSPTNIGMWMLSALAATDFGYLTLDQLIDQLTRTMSTLNQLERHEGHLLNWYSLEDRSPLNPRYVSSVDSGNFIAALWTLDQGIEELLTRPLLEPTILSGLEDTAELLLEELQKEGVPGDDIEAASTLKAMIANGPTGATNLISLVRNIHSSVETIAAQLREDAGTQAGGAYWARQLERQVAAASDLIDRYLIWMEILAERSESELQDAGLDDLLASRRWLHQSPSLQAMARGIPELADFDVHELAGVAEGSELKSWIERFSEAYSRGKWFAGEMLASGQQLQAAVRKFSAEINLGYLYDPTRRLFSIGHNVSSNQLDGSYYDLLASESRLGSYVAIARGDVPVEHWLALNRPFSSHGQHNVLLSWTGTMFEYLMPLLLQRTFPNSLLDRATREATALQMAYGRRRKVPWGISESAYGDLDLDKTYQYKAFGVPWLGLKRGLDEDLVISPYSTLLALALEPQAAIANLQRLTGQGLLDEYGFYEAIDFNRRPQEDAKPGVIVRAYMAHHQGMSFLALANFLHENILQRRFHNDPRVKAAEPLLYERVPVSPPIHHISTRENLPTRVGADSIAPSISKFDSAHSITPKVQLLSNGQLSTMTTNSGGGYTRWKGVDVTRWQADTTRDAHGSFIYLRDTESSEVWSNMFHPSGIEPDRYTVHFPLDRAEYRRRDNGIDTQTELIVSPEDDVEIRRITLTNRSLRSRRIEVTSYYELALAPHAADRQHPAFNKLFIQTEAVEASEALLAFRRSRQQDEPPIFAVHSLDLLEGSDGEGLPQHETDRRVFVGRGRTLRNPMGSESELNNTTGYVLDPVFSLRREVQLPPGQSVQLVSFLGVADSRVEALRLVDKYHDPAAVERAFEIAWASSQLELRLLRIHPDEARRFQKLAGYMLYPSSYLRPPADRIEANRKGQSGLWPYGISGDNPILLVTITDVGDLGLVRQMLQAQAYWRRHGLISDLVILNEESSSYEQPLMERLERLIQSFSMLAGKDQPGGVFLRAVDQIPPGDLILLQTVARVSLVAARGPLAQQMSVPFEVVEEPAPLETKRTEALPSRQLPFLELPYFNSLGGFSADGTEYVTYLGPDTNTPAPWVNIIANPQFGTMISETGAGFTWYGNSQRNRLTQWSNDPVLDPHSEVIYIRDEESGRFWNPTAGPIRGRNAYRISHGAGYTRFEHNSHAIEQLLTVFVPVDDAGGEPLKISKLTLRNDSKKTRKLSLTYYVEWALGEQREDTQPHIVSQWDSANGMILASNGYHPDFSDRIAFAAISPAPHSFTCDRTLFLGRNRSSENPAAMERIELGGRVGAELDPCGALQVKVELAAGESIDVVCLLGQAASGAEAGAIARKYGENLAVDQALEETRRFWDRRLGALQVETPELSANFLLNRWLLYQSLSCRIWGRSAFYQSGGAIGYRDQLQDVAAFLLSEPAVAREHILLAASRQYTEGDVQHWWHPPSGAGIRSRISDDLLWLPYVTSQYLRVTGDVSILDERVPFLIAPELEPDQHEVFLEPQPSLEAASLFEHCRRAVQKGLTQGPHGLPLIGTGDWNDGMNRVGAQGRGESVWLGWFLIDVLKGMVDMARLAGDAGLADHYHQEAQGVEQRLEQAAWDGTWYLRGTFDDGSPLGSATNIEARIDSLPQSWPWISDAGDPDRKAQALDAAWNHLVRRDEKLVLLFTPPFDTSLPSPGYIRGYPPGVRENGGQYTHAAIWLAMAFARSGDGNRAGALLQMLNPIEHAREVDEVWRYTVEPYVIAADVYNLPGRVGQGGWSWYTGSAAWMYRVWTEEVLGLKKRGQQLLIDPVIPDWWDGFKAQLRHADAIYEIEVENPDHVQKGVAWVEVDGRRVEDKILLLNPEPLKHSVRVRMGKSRS